MTQEKKPVRDKKLILAFVNRQTPEIAQKLRKVLREKGLLKGDE